jgi:hypothetical protein
VRTGIVLARQGGALAEMLPVFRLSRSKPRRRHSVDRQTAIH